MLIIVRCKLLFDAKNQIYGNANGKIYLKTKGFTNEEIISKEIYTKYAIQKNNVKDYIILGIKSIFQKDYLL